MSYKPELKKELIRLKKFYDNLASDKKYATSLDINLRELEIDGIKKYLNDGIRVLDIGCGNGYSTYKHAEEFKIEIIGCDYSDQMIQNAKNLPHHKELKGNISFCCANVLEIPFPDNYFDRVISTRCLMALLDWDLQKNALKELFRVLKPNGLLLLQEGTFQGLEKLNKTREEFGLDPISVYDYRWPTLKFDESKLISFCKDYYHLDKIHRFGMYYFISRVIHPLLVYPEAPKNDAEINKIARQIALKIPDYKDLGHLAFFVFRKKDRKFS
ncbi:MAG: class I SAM-dependent methyltransferase [Candidatus Nealsonbacteria bacterium]